MRKIPKKTFNFDSNITVFISSKNITSKTLKRIENEAKTNKLNLDCLPIKITKSQIKHIADVLTTTDVKAAFVSPEFSEIAYKLSDYASTKAKHNKQANFLIINKRKISAFLNESINESIQILSKKCRK